MSEKKKGFQLRAFISMLVTLSGIIIAFSGVVLYIVPPGRVAHWTNWTLFALTKEGWAAIHTIFSYIFIIVAAIHLIYNWKTFLGYLKDKLTKSFAIRIEWLLAVMLTILIWLATAFSLPPFSTVMAIGEEFKESWDEEESAPVPHTELYTLAEFASQFEVDYAVLEKNLKDNGYESIDKNETLSDIAEKMGISPANVYKIIIKDTKMEDKTAEDFSSDEHIEGSGTGSGYGMMSVETAAKKEGVDASEAVRKLKEAGIEANKTSKIKDLSDEAGKRPYEIISIIKEK